MSSKTRSRRSAVAVVVGAAIGLVGGAAFAQVVLVPAGVATEEGGVPAPAATPEYPINATGQTYGSLNDSVPPEDEPDLILVQATNGNEGYVLRETLDQVTGANVSSPEEAIAWQQHQEAAAWDRITIPVFESDGVRQIGFFEVTRSVLDQGDPAERATP